MNTLFSCSYSYFGTLFFNWNFGFSNIVTAILKQWLAKHLNTRYKQIYFWSKLQKRVVNWLLSCLSTENTYIYFDKNVIKSHVVIFAV